MIIRKLFKFENAHIVRGCSSVKCRSSVHGHSYKVEVLFESNYLDNGQMVYDFGLMKQNIKDLVESFDHAITLWSGDNPEYIADMKKHSDRWVELPVSPSAEQFSRVIFFLIDKLFGLTKTKNGEKKVQLHSVIVHETDTGYAQAFREDVYNQQMGIIELEKIAFSDAVVESFNDTALFEKLKDGEEFINPESV
ncbi:6-pyruvoyl trahydropterin synthase family protein [Sulfurimonas marina]|uniref:6-carboxy-5,6,7,8-tetrahydropterin synthase n=1 Tax=Sulfurimonas marina TaxID=2590551 RepID=A0A7M1AXB3_9BACT|nr:6-carboxytetrahydropterin synthase [Sulfurimonas marina]QOP42055.1 6-carboxytetrahydropterin synthase [Sulfurimonas marina]